MVESSSRIAPRKSPRKAKSSLSAREGQSNDEGKVFPLDVKAGDSVLFGKYSGTEIKIDGEELLIMREKKSSASSRNRAFSVSADDGKN